MNSRPWPLTLISLCFIAIALSFPVQISYLYGHKIWQYELIYQKLSIMNLVSMGMLFISAYFSYFGSPKLLGILPLTVGVLAFNNYLVYSYGLDYSGISTTLATFGIFAFSLLVLQSSCIQALTNPKIRWWLTSKRIEREIPLTLTNSKNDKIYAKTINISTTGLLIELPSNSENALNIEKGVFLNLLMIEEGEIATIIPLKVKVMRIATLDNGHTAIGVQICPNLGLAYYNFRRLIYGVEGKDRDIKDRKAA